MGYIGYIEGRYIGLRVCGRRVVSRGTHGSLGCSLHGSWMIGFRQIVVALSKD